MTDEQKWLVIFGSGWVDLDEVFEATIISYESLRSNRRLEFDLPQYRVRLKPNEPIRVHVAPPTGVRAIRASEDNSGISDGQPQGVLLQRAGYR
jgi:hypothetical protein